MNPFAHGWNAPGSSGNTVPQPSIFGALPYPTRSTSAMFMSFVFTSFAPTILDSTVVGPKSKIYFRVRTDVPTVGFTIIHNSANQPMIIIEWLQHPVIEIRDILSKRETASWLPLSADKSYRTMNALGKTFVWAPDGRYICLYSAGLGRPQIYARVIREEGQVTLELTAEAIQLGLLEICIAAALLLQCERRID
ncbi:hypothetical protein B0H16DRAFT_1861238 [Mycena metata]|uniref:Uncharacterized protein n=1 Tax=Mycena metata TaxID=1033252 RepID=A0AAD7IIA3_9AGAR|nr:hypothetical protein B0H16DRAFT_1770750 [Mycena metata]KAJ7742280.1 hypothetical protein B0H16DRAFT_1861238 [Mycena metata]